MTQAINDFRRIINALRSNLNELERALEDSSSQDVVAPSIMNPNIAHITSKKERYKSYFQCLCKTMETMPDTDWKSDCCPGDNWCRFLRYRDFDLQGGGNIRVPEFSYDARFARENRIVTALVIRNNRELYENLLFRQREIENDFGDTLEWIADASNKNRKIQTSRSGNILSVERHANEIERWHVDKLSKLDEVLTPKIKTILSDLQEEIFNN